MINFLVETKNEYTTHLSNILTPLIFEGFNSIYKEAIQLATNNEILKIFQTLLKRIPKWNQSIIDKETDRIINSSHSYEWLNDLIKATLKSNLVVLMYNPTIKDTRNNVKPEYYQNIKTSDFIHKVYIECARELWNNPYLLYHEYPAIEIKRNQRDFMNIIKDCIKEAIRKLLPVQQILKIYLGEDMQVEQPDDNFNEMSEAKKNNLSNLIKNNQRLDLANELKGGAHDVTNSESKTIGSKILDIMKKSESDSDSESNLKNIQNRQSSTSSDSSSSDLPKANILANKAPQERATNPHFSQTTTVAASSLDEKLKHILKNDLADSDLETSLNYDQEADKSKYQEIFSNSNTPQKTNTLKPSNNDKDMKNKSKFFNTFYQF